MKRNFRSGKRISANKRSISSRTAVFARLKWIAFLSILVLVLFYVNQAVFAPAQKPEKEAQSEVTDFSQWRNDFETILSRFYFPSEWVKGLNRLDKFAASGERELTVRITIPGKFSIHKMIFAILQIARENHLQTVESYEKLLPNFFRLSFTASGGKLLNLQFKTDADAEWYSGKIAVVIDDFGYKKSGSVDRFLRLPFPIAFSVIPGTEYDELVAQKAHDAGFDILIHLPMEALNTKVENRGYTIFTKMSEKQIGEAVAKAKKKIPFAVGLNNHMGSKATADRRTMTRFMKALKKYNLFFLDSETNRKSVAYLLAQKAGIPALKLTTYLDNPQSSKSVAQKLEEVVKNLEKTRTAVVIGHDRNATAKILTEAIPHWAYHGVSFVKLNELLENK